MIPVAKFYIIEIKQQKTDRFSLKTSPNDVYDTGVIYGGVEANALTSWTPKRR
jgi:hypothetical protein